MLINIKYKYTIFLSLLLFALILSGCGTKNKMDFYDKTPSIDLSKEKIGTVSIGSKEIEVKNEFGEPDFIENIKDPNSTHLIYGKDKKNSDLKFKIVEGIVDRYLLSSKEYETEKKISSGSSKEDVIEAYGDNYYERTDTGADVIGYFDKTNKINIEFTFNKNVVGILISDVNKDTK